MKHQLLRAFDHIYMEMARYKFIIIIIIIIINKSHDWLRPCHVIKREGNLRAQRKLEIKNSVGISRRYQGRTKVETRTNLL